MNNVFAMPVASPAFASVFAATVANFFPKLSIKVESASSIKRILKKHPDATFIEPACWDAARPKHYLCLVAPLSWRQIEQSMFLAPAFMADLVNHFGSAEIGAEGAEENQYLYLSAEILTLLGATHEIHEAFKRSPTASNLRRTLKKIEKQNQRQHVYEDVLGLDQGSYHSYLSELCTDLIDGIPRQ